MPKIRGATYIEWIIGGSILIMMTFSIIDFLLSYAARAAIHRGAQDALAVAIAHPNIASETSDNIDQLLNAVDEKGRNFPQSLFIGTVDHKRGLANLVLDQNNRAFKLVRPDPAQGKTLMNALQEEPVVVETTYERSPLFASITFGLLGSDTITETLRVSGYAELPPIPSVNRAQICISEKKDDPITPGGEEGSGGAPNSGDGGLSYIDDTCATEYCNGNDNGVPRCSAGQGRCYLNDLECIPCPDGFIPAHQSKMCLCGLNCNPSSSMQNKTYFKPDEDCNTCICDSEELVAACNTRNLGNGDRGCAKVPNFTECKCEPAPNCDPNSCITNPYQKCQCQLSAQTCQTMLGSQTAGLDVGNCACIDCAGGQRGGIVGSDGFCTCPNNNCGQGQIQTYWTNNFCDCRCDDNKGWELDQGVESEDGGITCKCKTNFSPHPNDPTRCKCNLTDSSCGEGKRVNQYHCDCRCTAPGYTEVGGTCTANFCLPQNCTNRTAVVTDPISGAIVSCECGGGH